MLKLSLWSAAAGITAAAAVPVSFSGDAMASGNLAEVVQLSQACASGLDGDPVVIGCKMNVALFCWMNGEEFRFWRPEYHDTTGES